MQADGGADRVGDDELLYRSVDGDPAKKHWALDIHGNLIVQTAAFLDPKFRPSVDRAHLRNHDPTRTQRGESDGVVKLGASDVRGIAPGQVSDFHQKGHMLQERSVDVVPDPTDETESASANPAHALVVTTPQIAKSNSAWGRLRIALAQVANARGWALRPPTAPEPE